MGMLSVIKNVPKLITKTTGKALFKLEKNKPQLLVGTGVVVAIGGFVWAIVNARKIDTTMTVTSVKVDELNEKKQLIANEAGGLTDEEKKQKLAEIDKQILQARAEGIWQMFLLMGVPCVVFVGGLALSVGGHIILVRRFGELSTAFATLQQTFDRYRAMNIAEHGEECDRRYRYGIVGETEAEATITDENGNEQTVKCKVPIVDKDLATSMYTFEFSEMTSRRCPKDPVSTISFLKNQERYWNMWMGSSGKPVTVAMVLDGLGIDLDPDDPRNDYILLAGWRPNGDGDNSIDFGIMRAVNKPALDMLENVVLLNLNCDGNIYHSRRYTKDGKAVGGR